MADAARATAPPALDSPYPGLTHYTERDAAFFFGRDADTSVIIGNLRASRLTLLYAESGVGKSSVLRAGVAAKLHELAERDTISRGSPRFVPVVFSIWNDDPVAGLVDAVDAAIRPFVPQPSELVLRHDNLEDALGTAAGVVEAKLLIILDQFEEHFVYRSRQNGGEPFSDQVARCVNRGDLPVNFLISIREDSYAGVGDLFGGRITNVYSNSLHLRYLGKSDAREAIEKPIERLNETLPRDKWFSIDPPLVEVVLDSVRRGIRNKGAAEDAESRDVLPQANDADEVETTYLQLVMRRLWDDEMASGSHVVRLTTLERLGGADAIIDEHLDRALATLPPQDQETAASIFTFLVTKAGTKIALTARDLSELSNLPEPRIDSVLRRLAAGDVLILRPVDLRDPGAGRAYEIFHDALARPIVEWRQTKIDARLDHERTQRQKAERKALRERKRRQRALAALGVFVVAFLGTAIAFAVVARSNARNQHRIGKSIQSANRIAALAASPSFGPGAAGLASAEAYRLAPTFEARAQLLAALQRNVGLAKIGVGHTRGVTSVAFIPRSTLIASGSSDGTVRLWDQAGRSLGPPLTTLGDTAVYGIATGTLGGGRALLAWTGSDGRVALWDVTRPTHPQALWMKDVSQDSLEAVAFSPKGSTLAAVGDDGRIRLWDVAEPRNPVPLGTWIATDQLYALAFSPDGHFLVTAGREGVKVWSVADLGDRDASKPTTLTQQAAYSVAWSPKGAVAAGIYGDKFGIRLWHLHDGRPERGSRFLTTTAVANALAFARVGSVLVSGGEDWNVTTWDVATGVSFGPPRAQGTNIKVLGVAADEDGRIVAGAGTLVKIWSLDDGSLLATAIGDVRRSSSAYALPSVLELAIIGSTGVVAAAATTRGLLMYRLRNPERVPRPVARVDVPGGAWSVAVHAETLAVAAKSTIELYDIGRTCKTMPSRPCDRGHVVDDASSIVFDRSGEYLASADRKNTVTLWKVGRAGPLVFSHRIVKERRSIDALAFDPTADILAVGGDDGTIRLFNIHGRAHTSPIAQWVGHERQSVSALAFSPDGKLLASGGVDQQVRLWRIGEGGDVANLSRSLYQTQTIQSVTFSPSGRTLAAGDGDGEVCLYDIASLRRIGSGECLLAGHSESPETGNVRGLLFTPDGRSLVTAADGSPIVSWSSILWRLGARSEEALVAEVCRVAGRNLTSGEWNNVFLDTPFANRRHRTCAAFP